MSIKDIDGAHAAPERFLVKPNLMDCRDITADLWQTKRTTNPLEPIYDMKDKEGNSMEVGEIEGSKPRLMRSVNEPFYRALNT